MVANVSIVSKNTAGDYMMIQFDVSWEHSWRVSATPPYNHDAAWIFIKYRTAFGEWHHATIDTTGHVAPIGSTILPGGDGIGAFIYRSTDGVGTVNFTSGQLRWDYGADGLADDEEVEIAFMVLEMVYVPQDSFYVGSGGTESATFYEYPTSTTPYLVSSEEAINVGQFNGYLYYSSQGDRSGPIPATYPEGYDAFYIMKYEMSQGQYADFLNLLTIEQDANRITSGGARLTISGTWPNRSASAPDRACNGIGWDDQLAYADWSGLRPMTELEFEKASRGPEQPFPNEYVWGGTLIKTSNYGIISDGTPGATLSGVTAGTGHAIYSVTRPNAAIGPLRVGIVSASRASPTRFEAGATYYGVAEMSGNLSEPVVEVGSLSARSFTGVLGDGELDLFGDSDVADWPDATASGLRGGNYGNTAANLRISDRLFASSQVSAGSSTGWRGVRSVPTP